MATSLKLVTCYFSFLRFSYFATAWVESRNTILCRQTIFRMINLTPATYMTNYRARVPCSLSLRSSLLKSESGRFWEATVENTAQQLKTLLAFYSYLYVKLATRSFQFVVGLHRDFSSSSQCVSIWLNNGSMNSVVFYSFLFVSSEC